MSQTSALNMDVVFNKLEDDRIRFKLVLFLRKIAPGRFKTKMAFDFDNHFIADSRL